MGNQKVYAGVAASFAAFLMILLFQNCAPISPSGTLSEVKEEAPTGEPSPVVLVDQNVGGGFVHKADYLFPKIVNSQTRAIVALHGGGGVKHTFAFSFGLKKINAPGYDSDPLSENGFDQKFLDDHNLIAVFIQGQSIPEKPGSYTWSNHIMKSAHDQTLDKKMLEFVSQDLRTKYGVSKVYLFGHSMGGVMTNRIWCESASAFDGYASIAGPMSSTNALNCSPSVLKPYLHIAALNDRIIQLVEEKANGSTVNHEAAEFLTLDAFTKTLGGQAFVSTSNQFKNELVSYTARAARYCDELVTPILSPSNSMWKFRTRENCASQIKMIEVRNADHCINVNPNETQYKCEVPIASPDFPLLSTIVEFLKQH